MYKVYFEYEMVDPECTFVSEYAVDHVETFATREDAKAALEAWFDSWAADTKDDASGYGCAAGRIEEVC